MIVILSTDIYMSIDSKRIIGISHSPKDAIVLARKDEDAMFNVQNKHGHIVFMDYTPDEIGSEYSMYSTDNEEFLKELFGEIPKDWKEIKDVYYHINENKEMFSLPVPPIGRAYYDYFYTDNPKCEQITENGFTSEEEEYSCMEDVMAEFDMEPEEVLELEPIKHFSQETLIKFKKEYVG